MLRVSQALLDVDVGFNKSKDIHSAWGGYIHALVQAIASQDRLYEVEVLKSLGDLSLHCGRTRKNEEDFKKAARLYSAAQRRCDDPDVRESLEDRLKFANKQNENLFGQKMQEQNSNSNSLTDQDVSMSRVSEILYTAEITEQKSIGFLFIRQSFANALVLVLAIMTNNSLLEEEALKSLGDLYLKKGRVGKNDSVFTKAAGLYRAALDRCEDPDGRETLEHRIKYTEKVKEKAKNHQEMRRPENVTTGNENKFQFSPNSRQGASCHRSVERIYEEQLQEGFRALQTGDLDTAERHFAAALNSVYVKYTRQHRKEAEPLCMLGDVYLKRGMQSKDGGDFTKAAALCNAALVRSERGEIGRTVQKITQSFIEHVLGIENTVEIDDVEKHKLLLKEDRDHVTKELKGIEQQIDPYSLEDDDPKLKEVEKHRAEAIKALFQTIVHQRRTFIAGLVDECIKVMGPLPCKYAMIGLGSQATGLATPYSDLEFAILIEEETESNVTYFRNLTHYLHLKVINLGETILPAMGIKSLNDFHSDDPLDNWFYDSVMPRGFAFDGAMPHASKTPLGRGKGCELIHSPSKMTNVLKDDLTLHLKKGYHLAGILGNVSFIAGEKNLVDVYSFLWTRILQKSSGIVSRLIAAITLSGNAPTFAAQALNARLLNVKKEIYRFASLAVASWALFNGIQPTTIWETIQKLGMNGVINSENEHHLMVMVSISAELRLRTYINNGGQMENMSALSAMLTETNTEEKLQQVFYFSKTSQLMRYYYTAQPLKKLLLRVGDSQPLLLFENSARLKAEVYSSLCDYHKAKTCAEQALQNALSEYGENFAHPIIVASFNRLGGAWMDLGDDRKAVRYWQLELQILWRMCGKSSFNLDIAHVLYNLGSSSIELGDHRKAIDYIEHALHITLHLYGKTTAHPDISRGLNTLGIAWRDLGDHRIAVRCFELSLQVMRRIYGDNIAHPGIANSLNNLGSAYGALGDHRKAISCHEQSLQILRSIYGENTAHPYIAAALNNLGTAWRDHGYHRKAISYYVQSLKIDQCIYGERIAHPTLARSLNNLGNVWGELGDFRKAIDYFAESLQMRRSIYGENTAHPLVATSLNNLGNALSELGDYKKAISCQQLSLQIMWGIYGETTAHPHIATALSGLGATWSELGDHRKAVSYFELSLQMERSVYGESTAHPRIAASLQNLGNAYRRLGDNKKAVSYGEQSLQMKRGIYGESTAHPETAASLISLAVVLGVDNDHKKAIVYCNKALQMLWLLYGKNTPSHPDIAASLYNLANSWGELGYHKKAVRYYEKSLQMMRRIYGETTAHPRIAMALSKLSAAWKDLGDAEKSATYSEQELLMKRTLDG